MTFKFFVSSAVVAAVITLIGNVVAAIISHRTAVKTAQETAGSEIQKMQATWDREDVVSSDDEFAEMASTVAQYIGFNGSAYRSESLAKVASLRAKEHSDVGYALDFLYSAINADNISAANSWLSTAISEKRAAKEKASNKP